MKNLLGSFTLEMKSFTDGNLCMSVEEKRLCMDNKRGGAADFLLRLIQGLSQIANLCNDLIINYHGMSHFQIKFYNWFTLATKSRLDALKILKC